jgi:hypothetical protein
MNQVEKIEGPVSHLPVAQSESASVLSMIERVARDPSVDINKMTQLMGWRKEMIADQRRAAFDGAMAAAKAEIPVITKNREVDFTSAKGRTNYRHEDLAEIARTVTPILGKFGLSYRFRVSSNINEPIVVTCIVSHREGHFEETTLLGPRDESGNKNAIQQVGSTLTYLQRMTLKAALGLAASNDDDGKASASNAPAPPPGSINDDQVTQIRDALTAKGCSERAFLQHIKQKSIESIPDEMFEICLDVIDSFRRK